MTTWKLGGKIDPSELGIQPATAPEPEAPISKPIEAPVEYKPFGSSFTGYGDPGAPGRNYKWLPAEMAAKKPGQYALLATDETKASSISDLLKSNELIGKDGKPVLGEDGKPRYVITSAYQSSKQEMAGDYDPVYTDHAEVTGSRDDFLKSIGMAGAEDGMRVAFSDASSSRGSVSGKASANPVGTRNGDDYYYNPERQYKGGFDQSAYRAIVAPEYKGFTQIGNLGPLEDDIEKMLGDIYSEFGASGDPKKQEVIKNALFKYDERFGVLANEGLVGAAYQKNNARTNGFWEKPVGQAIIQAVVTYVNPIAGAGYAGITAKSKGADWKDAIRAGVAAYAGGMVGGDVGIMTEGLGATASAAAGAAAGNATSQLIGTGKIDPKTVLAAGLSGGAGSLASDATAGLGATASNAAGKITGALTRNWVLGKKIDPSQIIGIAASAAGNGIISGARKGGG